MTTMDEQQEAKRRKLEALEAKMGGAPPPQAVRPAKMPNLPAVAPTPVSSAPTAAGASEEQTRSPFVCDANDVVQFRLVRTEADMDAAEVFEPEFTHQVFRDDETVFGYRDLEIKIFMSANLFKALVEISPRREGQERAQSRGRHHGDAQGTPRRRHLHRPRFVHRDAPEGRRRARPRGRRRRRVDVENDGRRRRGVRRHRARVQALRPGDIPVARAVRADDPVLHRRRLRGGQRGYQVAPLCRHQNPSG